MLSQPIQARFLVRGSRLRDGLNADDQGLVTWQIHGIMGHDHLSVEVGLDRSVSGGSAVSFCAASQGSPRKSASYSPISLKDRA